MSKGPGDRPLLIARARTHRMAMAVDLGFSREATVRAVVRRHGAGAGTMRCPECEGTGDWSRFYPEPWLLTDPLTCVQCKGTGRFWVGV